MHPRDLPEPQLITQTADLKKLVQTLSQQPLVAVDTEANSLYAYRERVCLIQFSIPEADYLVDPLALDDLSSLGEVFENPKIEKIFHAVEYDLIILQQDFGFAFCGLFDTMVAARILGRKSVGLSSILKSQFGINVDKKYQRANWGKRPLTKEMLAYAQLDTHYLIAIRNQLKEELKAKKRWKLALEDFQRACQGIAKTNGDKPVDCWRINGVRDLTGQQVAVLHELCVVRDKIARSVDRPLFKVINDKSLVNIAINQPKSLQELGRVPGVSQKQTQWIGKDLLTAVRRGSQKKPPKPPSSNRPGDIYLLQVENLRQWRKNTARTLGVESDVILPKDILYQLVETNPKTQKDFEEIMQPIPWRLRNFGDQIFEILQYGYQ